MLFNAGTAASFREFYLPHHGGEKKYSATTRLRLAFINKSKKTLGGPSLNDCLHIGPKFIEKYFRYLTSLACF